MSEEKRLPFAGYTTHWLYLNYTFVSTTLLGPFRTHLFLFERRFFRYCLAYRLPTAENDHRKRFFFSMKATLMYSCGWMKITGRFFKTITSRVIKVGNVFNATCGRGFFGKPGKNLRLQINTDTWRQGLSYTLGQVIWRTWMTTLGVFTSYHRGIPNTISWGAPLENVGEWCALWIWPPTFCTEKREF